MGIFDEQAKEYDAWFDKHPSVYQSELDALMKVMSGGSCLEVGVGTGRFALPLGISVGLDPSVPMISIARRKGIEVVRGVAEELPFKEDAFDRVLFVTTLCFIGNPISALAEATRVVKTNGRIVIGLIDNGSSIGRDYEEKSKGSPFYRNATFYSAEETIDMLRDVNCIPSAVFQTIFHDPKEITAPSPVIEGHGKGLFVVICARKNCRS